MRLRREGFTLVELLVVVSIIALLISILLPSLKKARDQAKLTLCTAHMRELGMGFHYYAEDNRQQPPPNRAPTGTPPEYRDGDWWYYNHMVPKYIPSNKKSQTNAAFGGVFECPSDSEAGRAYSMNIFASNLEHDPLHPVKKHATTYVRGKPFNPISVRSPHLYLLFGEAHAIFADSLNPGKYGTRYIIGTQGSSVYRKFMTVPEPRGTLEFKGYINFARHKGRAGLVLADTHVEPFQKSQLVEPAPATPGRWISTLRVRWSPEDEQWNLPSPPP